MIKEIIFRDIGCKDAYDVAFDYMALVEKIQTWNISNKLNEIDAREIKGDITSEELRKFSFSKELDTSQQILRNNGEVPLGKNRRMLTDSRRYDKGEYFERHREWHIQAKNKERKWYTSDVITIHSFAIENESSQYDLTIKSNSRNLMDQMSKDAFPPKFGKPAVYKCARAKGESVEVDVVAVDKLSLQIVGVIVVS